MQNRAGVLAVIPARWASSRFPGKPLVVLAGKPMVIHVWEKVRDVRNIERTVVATDSRKIYNVVRDWGGEAIMTSVHHASGSDRMGEVARRLPYAYYLNVQGDEPMISPRLLGRLVAWGRLRRTPIATLATMARGPGEYNNPNCVKIAVASDGRALYFSRAPIPYRRESKAPWRGALIHKGIYLFRRQALLRFVRLKPSLLEEAEKLEQLRALENGLDVHVLTCRSAWQGVDTPLQAAQVSKILERAKNVHEK